MSDADVEIAEEFDEDFEFTLANDVPFSDVTSNDRRSIDLIRSKLTGALPTEYDDDYNLVRWLHGYNGDIDATAKALRAHLRFYSAWGLKSILDEKRDPLLAKHYPSSLFAHTISDNDNSLLSIECIGRLDSEGLFKTFSSTKITRDRVHCAEQALRAVRAQEQRTGRQAFIFQITDLDGLKFDSQTLLTLMSGPYRLLCEFLSRHYVEMVSRFVIINAPSFFGYAWSVFAPFLPARTREKVSIFTADNPALWKVELLKYVDPARLPVHWGGTLRDAGGDPMCRSMVVVPPDAGFPKEAYWSVVGRPVPEGDLVTLPVGAGKCVFVDVFMKVGKGAEKTLEWYFVADSNHSFGVYYSARLDDNFNEIAAGGGQQEIESALDGMEMVYPHFLGLPGPTQVPERGRVQCRKTGWYKLKFGNEMGWWWQTLTIKYKAWSL